MNGADEQLRVNPEFNSVEASHPEGKRGQSADEVGQLGEAVFDASALAVELLTGGGAQ